MTSNCGLCKTNFQTTYLDEIDKKHLIAAATWYQWEKGEDGQTQKSEKKGTFENLLSALQNLTKFLLHYIVNKLQTEAHNAYQLTVTAADSNTAVVQVDFSENFCVYQGEVSSAHWKTNSVTLYTVMIWFTDESISTVLLSDNNDHWWYHTLCMFSNTSKNTLETMFMILRSGLMDLPVSLRINTSLHSLASPYLS